MIPAAAVVLLLLVSDPAPSNRPGDDLFASAEQVGERLNKLVQHAHERYTAGEFDKAIRSLDAAAINLDPAVAAFWSGRGAVRAAKKDLDGVLADFDTAHKLDPKSAAILCQRGVARYNRGDLDQAELGLIAALNLDPRCGQAWRGRGAVRTARNEYELAVADFTQAIELDAKDPDGYVRRGDVWVHQEDWEKAAADYTKAIDLDPKSAAALTRRGTARLRQREYGKAFDDFSRAVVVTPKSAESLTGRGVVHTVRQDYTAAVVEYEKAVDHDPKCTDALYYLTYLYALSTDENLRDPKKAVVRGKKLVAAAPKAWWAWQALAVAHTEAGDFDAATAGMRTVLESKDLSHADRETAARVIELFLADKPLSSVIEE